MPPLIDDWSQYLTAVGSSQTTIRLYTKVACALMRESGVSCPSELTRRHVIAYLARPVKPWSKLTYWKVIRALSSYLRDFEHSDVDLLEKIPRPRTPDPVARPIDDETIHKLLAARLSSRAHAYIRLALYGGLRVHEIASIRGEHFDWAAGWLMITGKGGRTAPIPIHPEVAKLAEQMPEFGYWFPSPVNVGRPVAAIAVSQTIGAALMSIGSRATAHQLRDTAATRIQRQTKDIRVTQSMLRHRNIRSTQKYTEVSNADMQAAVASLDWRPAA